MTSCVASRADGRDDAGFSLLELIVTLGLLSLIVAAILAGLGTGRRVWQLRGDLENISALGAARSVLDARLGDAMPLAQRSASGVLVPAFDGTPESLTFVASLQQSPSGSGLYRQTIRLVQDQDSKTTRRLNLVLEESLFPGGSGDRAAPPIRRLSVLVENVEQVGWRYFGTSATGQSAAWTGNWRRLDALPQMIGLSLRFPPGDARRWPELLMAPRIGAAF